MDKFYKQVAEDYKFRIKQGRLIPAWGLVGLGLISFVILIVEGFNRFGWLLWIMFIIFMSTLMTLSKYEGYKDGYYDGAKDTKDRM